MALHACKNEHHLLSGLDHPSVIKIIHFSVNEELQRCYTVLERAQGQNLEHMHSTNPSVILSRFKKILEAVVYLHEQKVCHRDLKPDNIIFCADGDVKLIDFNVAFKFSSQKIKGGTGLKQWSAPETRQSFEYDEKCDVWSLGLILAYMLSMYIPSEAHSFEQIRTYALDASDDMRLQQMLTEMLTVDPESRPTAAEVLEDFF